MRGGTLFALLFATGCVDGFAGSNVQIDLNPRTPVQASAGAVPGTGELPANIHFNLYAIREANGTDALFELQAFEIHKIVDLESPCFIDVGANVPFPGIHVSQFSRKTGEVTGITDITNPPAGATMEQQVQAATAVVRNQYIGALGGMSGPKAVTSASATTYPTVDANCTGSGLPPPDCIDDASNARRLQICQAAWAADPLLWEGTDRVLTAPLAGTTLGFVVGVNPATMTPIGGAQFVVPDALEAIDEYAIYFQTDGAAGPGTLFLQGRPGPTVTRGVSHVHMESPFLPNLINAELAIFTSLDEDDVHF